MMNSKKENEILLDLLGVSDNISIDIWKLTIDEWNALVEKAKSLRVASIIYYRIGKSDIINKIPKNVLMSMRKIYLNSLSINMRLQTQLLIILDRMQSAGISAIILKGFALGETIYKNIAIRPMGDIDLIVKAEYFKKFDDIMLDSGWKNESYLNRLGSGIRHSKHIAYSKNRLHIEIHPKIYELPLIDPWERATKIDIEGKETYILGAEDFLLHLCLHLEYHGLDLSTNLLWYIDIVEFLNVYQDNIDWAYVIDAARKNKVDDSLHRTLVSIKEIFGCNIPADIINQLGNGIRGINYQFKFVNGLMNFLNPVTSRIFGHRALPLHHKVHIAFRSIFPSKDYMIFYYSQKHPNLFFIHYFTHIVYGVEKLFKALFHIFIHHKRKRQ